MNIFPLRFANEKMTLQEIVETIEIHTDGRISQGDYSSDAFPLDGSTDFQHLSLEIKHQYLRSALQQFLYQTYFSRYVKFQPPRFDYANDTTSGLHVDLSEQLHQQNCGQGYFDPDWLVCRQEADGKLAVKKSGLTLHIERFEHLIEHERAAEVNNLVSILLPKNLMDEDYYIAAGNAGYVNNSYHLIVNYFLNVDSKSAALVMDDFTRFLNADKIPFLLKLLNHTDKYHRCDCGILSVSKNKQLLISQFLQTVYPKYQFRTQIPLFTKLLAPGLSIAEHPTTQLDFGRQRCQLVADALLDDYPTLNVENRSCAIARHFEQAGIDMEQPYLNSGSVDDYEVFI